MMSDTQTADEVVDDVVEPPAVETEAHEGPSAEEAMAQMRRDLEASEAARAAAEQRAASASTGLLTANEIAINEAIQNTEAQLARQRAAYRTAREGGDFDAEQAANEESAILRVRLEGLKRDKDRMKAAPPQQQRQAPQNQSRIPGPAARAWMDDHPKINTDPNYAHAAESAHNRAIAAGHEPESPGYFQSINSELARSFGPDHGRDAVSQPGKPAPPARRPVPSSSYAAPPGRGNAGAKAGADVKSIAARLNVQESDIIEHAAINKMSVEKYCKMQDDILKEQGANNITYGDGAVFR